MSHITTNKKIPYEGKKPFQSPKKTRRVLVKLNPLTKGELAQMNIEQLSTIIKDLKGRSERESIDMLSTAIEIYMVKMKMREQETPVPRESNNEFFETKIHTTPIKQLEKKIDSKKIIFKPFLDDFKENKPNDPTSRRRESSLKKSVYVQPLVLKNKTPLENLLKPMRIVGNSNVPKRTSKPLQHIQKKPIQTVPNFQNIQLKNSLLRASIHRRNSHMKINIVKKPVHTPIQLQKITVPNTKKFFSNFAAPQSRNLSVSNISRGYQSPPKAAYPSYINRSIVTSSTKISPNRFRRNCRSKMRFGDLTHPLLSTSRERSSVNPNRFRNRTPKKPSMKSSAVKSNKKVRFKDDFDCDLRDEEAREFQNSQRRRYMVFDQPRRILSFEKVNKLNRDRGSKRNLVGENSGVKELGMR